MNTREGATLGGLHVLTDAELNRIIAEAIQRHLGHRISYAHAARRQAWAKSSRKRYARYLALCNDIGIPRRRDWTRHLHELEHP